MADDFQVHFSQTEYGPLEDYAEEHSSRGGTLLEELVRTTWQRSIHPRMVVRRVPGAYPLDGVLSAAPAAHPGDRHVHGLFRLVPE